MPGRQQTLGGAGHRSVAAMVVMVAAVLGLAGPALAEQAPAEGDWPQWRGPNRDGVSYETGWLSTWPKDGPKVLWKVSVGAGFSAVSTQGRRVYTLGNRNRKDTLWCLDADTGQVLWSHSYGCPGAGGGFPGPAASPTIDGGCVYTLRRVGHILCLKAKTGRVVWFRNPQGRYKASKKRRPSYWHGAACSPLVEGRLVILELGAEEASVLALHKTNGNIVWQAGDEKLGYSSPVISDVGGRRSVTVFTGSAVLGIDVTGGQLLWRFPWRSQYQSSIVSPVVAGDRVYVSTSQNVGCALLRISAEGPAVVWKNKNMFSHYSTPVLWEGCLYGLDGGQNCPRDGAETLLKCLDFRTGAVKWSKRGFAKGGLMLADGKLIVLSEAGELAVVAASPHGYKEFARAKVLDGRCWTMPVLSHGRLYCRNHNGDLVCLDVRGG